MKIQSLLDVAFDCLCGQSDDIETLESNNPLFDSGRLSTHRAVQQHYLSLCQHCNNYCNDDFPSPSTFTISISRASKLWQCGLQRILPSVQSDVDLTYVPNSFDCGILIQNSNILFESVKNHSFSILKREKIERMNLEDSILESLLSGYIHLCSYAAEDSVWLHGNTALQQTLLAFHSVCPLRITTNKKRKIRKRKKLENNYDFEKSEQNSFRKSAQVDNEVDFQDALYETSDFDFSSAKNENDLETNKSLRKDHFLDGFIIPIQRKVDENGLPFPSEWFLRKDRRKMPKFSEESKFLRIFIDKISPRVRKRNRWDVRTLLTDEIFSHFTASTSAKV